LLVVILLGQQISLLGYAALSSAIEIFLAIVVLSQTLPMVQQSFWAFIKDIVRLPQYAVQPAFKSKLISKFFRK